MLETIHIRTSCTCINPKVSTYLLSTASTTLSNTPPSLLQLADFAYFYRKLYLLSVGSENYTSSAWGGNT